MEQYFALIKNNIVQSVVIGDNNFLNHIKSEYDFVIDVSNIDRPNVGDSYYPDTGTFISNIQNEIQIPEDLNAPYLLNGTEAGFEPFKLSKYLVTYDNGIVTIGCKQYPATALLEAAYKALIEKETGTVSVFLISPEGPAHGKFGITWDDTQKLYDVLSKVKFQ